MSRRQRSNRSERHNRLNLVLDHVGQRGLDDFARMVRSSAGCPVSSAMRQGADSPRPARRGAGTGPPGNDRRDFMYFATDDRRWPYVGFDGTFRVGRFGVQATYFPDSESPRLRRSRIRMDAHPRIPAQTSTLADTHWLLGQPFPDRTGSQPAQRPAAVQRRARGEPRRRNVCGPAVRGSQGSVKGHARIDESAPRWAASADRGSRLCPRCLGSESPEPASSPWHRRGTSRDRDQPLPLESAEGYKGKRRFRGSRRDTCEQMGRERTGETERRVRVAGRRWSGGGSRVRLGH